MSDKNNTNTEDLAPGQKSLTTGEIVPPQEHEQYTAEFNKRVQAEQKEREDAQAARQRTTDRRAAARTPAPATAGKGDDGKK